MRPQRVFLAAEGDATAGLNTAQAEIDRVLFLGHRTEFQARIGAGEPFIVWAQETRQVVQPGTPVRLAWSVKDTFAFPVGD